MELDLSTTVGGVTLANPVMPAAGCAGSGRELAVHAALGDLGAFVTRSVLLDPPGQDATSTVLETPSGLLTAPGPHGSPLQGFLATQLPWLVQQGAPVFVSLAAVTLGEWAELARRVAVSPGVAGLELNLAWPPRSRVSADAHQVGRIVAAVCRELPAGVPVLAKVASEAATVVEVAAAAAGAGAAAVVVGHGLPGLALDPRTLRPRVGHDHAALTGPAVHPVALRCLWEVHRALPEVPLVGCGGVRSGRDALAMLAAGAHAVQVGSALLHDPCAAHRVLEELTADLAARDLTGLADVVGAAHHPEGDPR